MSKKALAASITETVIEAVEPVLTYAQNLRAKIQARKVAKAARPAKLKSAQRRGPRVGCRSCGSKRR